MEKNTIKGKSIKGAKCIFCWFKVKPIRFIVATKDLLFLFLLIQPVVLSLFLGSVAKKRLFPKKLVPLIDKIRQSLGWLANKLEKGEKGSISQREIIYLSLKNMGVKGTRSLVTIGGMGIGIAAIVFLVSIGYGVQDLVVSRVAKLEEMKQADVAAGQGNLYITDETLAVFADVDAVDEVFPIISMVGRVDLNNSIIDVVVHGVTSGYLENSAIKESEGKFFDSNETVITLSDLDDSSQGEVAGVQTEGIYLGQKIGSVSVSIAPDSWIRIRGSPSVNGEVLGYTRRVEGTREGVEVWGGGYTSESGAGKAGLNEDGKEMGKWLEAEVPLWQETGCLEEQVADCEDGKERILDEDGIQVWQQGYFAEINVTLETARVVGEVLGETDEASVSGDIEAIEVGSNADIDKYLINATASGETTASVEKKSLSDSAKRQVVVSSSMVEILGITVKEAIGKEIELTFVSVGSLIPDEEGKKVESAPEKYTIVAVVPGDKNPIVWVPFVDLRGMGVSRYSQARVLASSKEDLAKIRQQIEVMGYKTSSVADTVERIEGLFSTIRMVLASLGMIALAVASLGMFNTLTVSLLERTREVGVMKVIGMKSKEVRELFLTESMIMGFFGGLVGIIMGLIFGNLLSISLSLFSVIKGVGMIKITSLPFTFTLIIVLLSLLVGFLTGLYPARRAKDISALNAVRYE